MATATVHVVKQVCKNGIKIDLYYADTREGADAYVADLRQRDIRCTYIVEAKDVTETEQAENDAFWRA